MKFSSKILLPINLRIQKKIQVGAINLVALEARIIESEEKILNKSEKLHTSCALLLLNGLWIFLF